MRYDIRDGDETTAGGIVSSPDRNDLLMGKAIAYEGDHVECYACGVAGYILCTGKRPEETGAKDKRSALSGDLCICKCNPPPTLIASQFTSGCP